MGYCLHCCDRDGFTICYWWGDSVSSMYVSAVFIAIYNADIGVGGGESTISGTYESVGSRCGRGDVLQSCRAWLWLLPDNVLLVRFVFTARGKIGLILIVAIEMLASFAAPLCDVKIRNRAMDRIQNKPCVGLSYLFHLEMGQNVESGRAQGHSQPDMAWMANISWTDFASNTR
ncbi:hypothetical protein F5146DRAFT_2540 [Armillaria mellea]|nr:hypothetical protein F5146DRAFT_2540 [Armillaria mellea]